MAFRDEVERINKQAEERGYSRAEMESIRRRIESDRSDWIRHFDEYIEHNNYNQPDQAPEVIVERARKLADRRAEVLAELFPEDLDKE